MKKELKIYWELTAKRGVRGKVTQSLSKEPTEKDILNFAIDYECGALPISIKKFALYI